MHEEYNDIKEVMGKIVQRNGPIAITIATVTAVNGNDTVKITFIDDSTIDDCRLKAVVKSGNKFLLIPKVNSNVLVGFIDNSKECVVLAVHEIDEIKSVINNVTFDVDATGFLLQKNTDTLKKILTDIIDAVMPIVVVIGNNPDYAKLTTALTSVNNLLR